MRILCSICQSVIPLQQPLDQTLPLSAAIVTMAPCPNCSALNEQQLFQLRRTNGELGLLSVEALSLLQHMKFCAVCAEDWSECEQGREAEKLLTKKPA